MKKGGIKLKRHQLFEKYKEEHSEFKNIEFGNIKKEVDCDELMVVHNEDGYVFNYVLFNVITAKVFYNENFEIHNEKGPAIIEAYYTIGYRNKIIVYPEEEKFCFYKKGKYFGFIYENKEYTVKIWNDTFDSIVGRLRNKEKLERCLEVAKKFEKKEIIDKINVKLVALSLTKN